MGWGLLFDVHCQVALKGSRSNGERAARRLIIRYPVLVGEIADLIGLGAVDAAAIGFACLAAV